jgi:hypothetical protein
MYRRTHSRDESFGILTRLQSIYTTDICLLPRGRVVFEDRLGARDLAQLSTPLRLPDFPELILRSTSY